MTDSTNKKINPQDVKGLPKGACIQSNRYVYFSYAFRSNGKSKHERDYLGTIEKGVFVPNDYYKLRSPTRENRPLENWKDPVQRAKAEQRLKDRQAAQSTLDVPAGEDLSKSVGVTALAVSMLYKSGMVEDVGNAVFNGNVEDTMHAINLGMHAAVTAVPTYFAYGDRCRLLNVTEKDRKLVACLGFEGLFDDAKEVNNLLSARRLSMHLKEKRRDQKAAE